MRIKLLFSVVLTTIMFFVVSVADAQVLTKDEHKELEKREKFLNKQIKGRAIRDARREARQLEKDGYKTSVGKLPLDKQLEKSWQVQYELDKNGYPFYIVATAKAIGGNYSAAQMQAVNLAKLELAGQIQTKVNQLIEAKVATDELGKEEAVSINSMVAASKSVISNTLGRTLPLVEIYKTLDNKNTEVMITLGYNSDLAASEAIKAMQKGLDEDATDLMEQLDSLLGVEEKKEEKEEKE